MKDMDPLRDMDRMFKFLFRVGAALIVAEAVAALAIGGMILYVLYLAVTGQLPPLVK